MAYGNFGYGYGFYNPQYQPQPQFQPQPAPQPIFTEQRAINTSNALLGGKIVDSVELVKVMDIPMDGSIYYFPKADGTEIYTKRWREDGRTQINVFSLSKPTEEVTDEQTITNQQIMDMLNNGFDTLNEKLEKFVPMGKKTSKKETDNE